MASEAAIELDLDTPTTRVFSDAGSRGGKCIAGDIADGNGRLLSLDTPPLAPGVYRLTLRMKVSHTVSEHTARLEFDVSARSGSELLGTRDLTILGFERPGVYQTFTLPFTVEEPDSKVTVAVDWVWNKVLLEKRPVDMTDAPVAPAAELLDEDAIEARSFELERALSSITFHLACDRAQIERVADVRVHDLAVDKIRYLPGDTAKVTGVVSNYRDQARTLTLVTEIIRGMDEARTVDRRVLEIGAHSHATFAVDARLSDRKWGREVRCRLIDDDGNVAGESSEYFTVHDNLWAVVIGGQTMDGTIYRAGEGGRNARAAAEIRKQGYANQVEFVFWAPDDFGDLTPVGDFKSGQMHRSSSAESTKWLIDAFHEQGIAVSFYSKFCTPGGKAGYEVYRKHPNWFDPSFYDMAQLDRWDRSEGMSVWPRLTIRGGIDEPYKHHAREIVATVREFGWDAIRYDSHTHGKEAYRVLKIIKAAVRDELPDLKWGYNDSVHREQNPLPGHYELLCEDGSLIMDEYNVHAMKDRWTYDHYSARHIIFRAPAHERGGHVVYCPFEAKWLNDALYQKILVYAARAHCSWEGNSAQSFPALAYNRFATRYAGYVWDNSYRLVPDAANRIDWESAADKLYKWPSYTYYRKTPGGGTVLVMHMVNAPTAKRVDTANDCRVPEPVEEIACAIKLPDAMRATKVWCASADDGLNQDALPFEHADGVLRFTVPKLRFWNMVVVECEGEGKWE